MKKNMMIALVLGVLVLIAAVQAYQLMGLKNSIAGGSVQSAAVSTPVQSGAGGGSAPALPSSLQNLPDMVGGC